MTGIGAPAGALLARLGAREAELDGEAAALDAAPGFPVRSLAILRETGALAAPLPAAHGGLGLGTEPAGAAAIAALLRAIGRASLPVGRLFEGHVNALRLVFLYGAPPVREAAARDARAGHLHAIWVTDGADPVRLGADGVLAGEKAFCSGACHVTRPLITAAPDGGGAPHMLVVPLDDHARAEPSVGGLQGMRGAETGRCSFAGLRVGAGAAVGAPGDYLREPEFSAGAWRGIAVALGGVDRLVDEFRAQLAARGRADSPAQLARIGEALIARETASMWAHRAAMLAEGAVAAEPADVAATVNLARIAAEAAALDVLRLVARGLGLAAFRVGNPAERVGRDLATYLRQPAPDETLAEGARRFLARDLPPC